MSDLSALIAKLQNENEQFKLQIQRNDMDLNHLQIDQKKPFSSNTQQVMEMMDKIENENNELREEGHRLRKERDSLKRRIVLAKDKAQWYRALCDDDECLYLSFRAKRELRMRRRMRADKPPEWYQPYNHETMDSNKITKLRPKLMHVVIMNTDQRWIYLMFGFARMTMDGSSID